MCCWLEDKDTNKTTGWRCSKFIIKLAELPQIREIDKLLRGGEIWNLSKYTWTEYIISKHLVSLSIRVHHTPTKTDVEFASNLLACTMV